MALDTQMIRLLCQADDCIAEEQSNRSLGIPTDAALYETIIHTDMQTQKKNTFLIPLIFMNLCISLNLKSSQIHLILLNLKVN